MKTVKDVAIVLAVIFFTVIITFNIKPRKVLTYEKVTDTIVMWDTVSKEIPKPHYIHIERIDTVFLYITIPEDAEVGNSVKIDLELPIERKEYITPDYHAIVEGWKPSLVGMTLYQPTKVVTNTDIRTEKIKPRWGLGVQLGGGYVAGSFGPYIGVGVQYNLITW